MKPTPEKPRLVDALVEYDEALATELAINNIFHYGTDDPKKVAAIEAEMDRLYAEFYDDYCGVQDRPSDYTINSDCADDYENDDYWYFDPFED